MKFIFGTAIISMVVFASSCGDSSTSDTGAMNDSTTVKTDEIRTDQVTTTSSVEVPVEVKTSFETKNPKATNVTWKNYEPVSHIEWDLTDWPLMEANDYYVTYDMDGMTYHSWYDDKYNWIATTNTMTDHAGLPAAVNKVLNSQFAGYTIENIDKENDKNREAYEIDLVKGEDKMTVLIDVNGNIMKKKGRVDGEKIKIKNV